MKELRPLERTTYQEAISRLELYRNDTRDVDVVLVRDYVDALEAQLTAERARAEKAEADAAVMQQAAQEAIALAERGQGEWLAISRIFAPEWTWDYKDIADILTNGQGENPPAKSPKVEALEARLAALQAALLSSQQGAMYFKEERDKLEAAAQPKLKALTQIPPEDDKQNPGHLDVGIPLIDQLYEWLESVATPESEMTLEEYFRSWTHSAAEYLVTWDAMAKALRPDGDTKGTDEQ